MCLLIVAHEVRSDLPLLLLANRDEYYERPAAPLDFWQEHPAILGGRDLRAGGTWLAFHRDGRWAALTNAGGEPPRAQPGRSRGLLIADYLTGGCTAAEYVARIQADEYAGFNLLVGEPGHLEYVSNHAAAPGQRSLPPGLYGLSNAALDTPWPKLVQARELVARALERQSPAPELLALFQQRGPEPGVGSIWVQLPHYGTRCTTLAVCGRRERQFWELRYPDRGLRHFRLSNNGHTQR